jgi:hypothetical protein
MTYFRWLVLVALAVVGFSLCAWAADEPAEPAATEEQAEQHPEQEATQEVAEEEATQEVAEEADQKKTGPIACWNFDEGEGDTVKDSAGENNGKITNAKWVDGKVGKALDFDGQSAYVEIPHSDALNLTQAITIEAWVKHRGEYIYSWEAILAKGDSAYRIHFDETDQSFGLGLNGMGQYWNQQSGVVPEPDKWYFFVATFDRGKACLYVDGKQAAATEQAPTEIMTNNYSIIIGENNESPGRYFNGTIDEVKIYNRALTAEEVAKQFEQVK